MAVSYTISVVGGTWTSSHCVSMIQNPVGLFDGIRILLATIVRIIKRSVKQLSEGRKLKDRTLPHFPYEVACM